VKGITAAEFPSESLDGRIPFQQTADVGQGLHPANHLARIVFQYRGIFQHLHIAAVAAEHGAPLFVHPSQFKE
jgi:hypothetical protein